MPEFSRVFSQDPKTDFAAVDGAGNRLANVLDTLSQSESLQEDSRRRGEAFVGIRLTAKNWETLKPVISCRPAQVMTEFDSTRLVSVSPHAARPIFFEVEFCGLCANARQAAERANPAMALPEIEWVVLSGPIFQVLKQAHGSQEREEWLHIGGGSFDFIQLQTLFESTGNQGADGEIKLLADELRAKRKQRDDALARAPKPVDPRADFAAAVAAGVVQTLAALGIKPNPTKP